MTTTHKGNYQRAYINNVVIPFVRISQLDMMDQMLLAKWLEQNQLQDEILEIKCGVDIIPDGINLFTFLRFRNQSLFPKKIRDN